MLKILSKCRLFEGLTEEEITRFAHASGRTAMYSAGRTVLGEGESCSDIGILLSGSLIASSWDRWGKPSPVTKLSPGDIFGDVLASGTGRGSPVTVKAAASAEIIFIPFSALLNGETLKSGGQTVLKNLSAIISDKYFELFGRIRCLTAPTLRDKIYTMLYHYGKAGETFSMPMDREKMAAYLDCDRSALSRELSRMKAEGIIDFYKNTFRILACGMDWTE